MKGKYSVFDKYLMGIIDEGNLEGIHFLDIENEKKRHLNREVNEHLINHFNMDKQEKEVMGSLKK